MDNIDEMEETSSDVKGFNLKPENTSNPNAEIVSATKFDPGALYYDMSGDKIMIILNHHTFKKTRYFQYKTPTTRNGTDEDVKSLDQLFKYLGFNIIEFTDLVYDDIFKNITKIASRDHSQTSCICVTILTHGKNGGEVYAADRPYLLHDLITIFEKQPTLVNKPKLFFVQACRGDSYDVGNSVQLDSENELVLVVPTHADLLVLYSTVEDYMSYRDVKGSWMIQALCSIVTKHHEDMDLLQMITLVHRKVAYEKAVYTPRNRVIHNTKQMPETRFTLTKLLKF